MEKNGHEKKTTNKKKMSNRKKILIITLSIIAILAVAATGVYMNFRNKIYTEYTPKETEGISYKEVEGVTNVLLIGTDGRDLEEPARSDTMIIATIDSNNKIVKTTSIMRDTLVNLKGHGEQKINAAFSMGSADGGADGGIKLLMETIRDTFEISLDKYVVVNFWGFESIVEEIGGIEVDVKDYEIPEINKYIGESTGTKSELITDPGVQNLNGAQALSYARIRKVGNGSYERTERQRIVLLKALEKLKTVNPIKYISIANKLAEHVKTNIDIPEALNLAYTIYKFPELKFEQLQIPQNELVVKDGSYKNLGWVLLIDKKQNAKVMQDFIFNNKIPNPDEYDYNALADVKSYYDEQQNDYISQHGVRPDTDNNYDDNDNYNNDNSYNNNNNNYNNNQDVVPDKNPPQNNEEPTPPTKPEQKPEPEQKPDPKPDGGNQGESKPDGDQGANKPDQDKPTGGAPVEPDQGTTTN